MQLTPESSDFGEALVGRRLHEIADWKAVLPRPDDGSLLRKWEEATEYLQRVMPQA